HIAALGISHGGNLEQRETPDIADEVVPRAEVFDEIAFGQHPLPSGAKDELQVESGEGHERADRRAKHEMRNTWSFCAGPQELGTLPSEFDAASMEHAPEREDLPLRSSRKTRGTWNHR